MAEVLEEVSQPQSEAVARWEALVSELSPTVLQEFVQLVIADSYSDGFTAKLDAAPVNEKIAEQTKIQTQQ
ncbi:MAG: hypothetical protein JWO41_620 [Candidatus Saccharibacteria bacterium]|nr:hypothetical protein [Candidatus Saccharibacteria bacterium]